MGGSIVFDGHRVASSWPVILGILESKAGLNYGSFLLGPSRAGNDLCVRYCDPHGATA